MTDHSATRQDSPLPHDASDVFTADSPPLQAGDGIPFALKPLCVLIVVPTLQAGAADEGAIELARMLAAAGHRPIVVSRGGRWQDEIAAAGGEFVIRDVASKNPFIMLRNALALARLIRERRCDLVHAYGRAPAWSAYFAARLRGVPFLTTWTKGFREQNALKHMYNSVMARGDRVIAVSDQLADLINDRYGTSFERITVVPRPVDLLRFDPAGIAPERIAAVRRHWGVEPDTKVVLVVGRMLRRKGHHVVVQAMHRLKELGLKNVLCVFIGEDHGHTRYAGELWDLVLSTNTTDVIRLAGPATDLPASYAAATVVVSAATQPEGLQRSILEAQAMGRPVIVSDLGAGPEAVLAPPSFGEDRMTGLRVSAGDPAALAAALVRLVSLSDAAQRSIGARGRSWVASRFDAAAAAEPLLNVYAELAGSAGRHRR